MKINFIRIGCMILIIWNSFSLSYHLEKRYKYVEKYFFAKKKLRIVLSFLILTIALLAMLHSSVVDLNTRFIIEVIFFIFIGISLFWGLIWINIRKSF